MFGFVNMKNFSDYIFLSEQGLVKNLGEILKVIEKFIEEWVLEIYEEIEEKYKYDEYFFYVELYKNI